MDAQARAAAKTPLTLPLGDLDLNSRQIAALNENGISTAGDFLARLAQGEESLLEIPGIGRKVLSDLKKSLRSRGYDVPKAAEAVE
ncbi:MAG: DNA-directed RNA polymerase subunit alpha C-terminal domain-containing protein [Chloroflexota bacterium]|nr:DNA-directed RNA polymerase subunit alpha C-terminal domain-containing protein [Chloroflexota bacterium]